MKLASIVNRKTILAGALAFGAAAWCSQPTQADDNMQHGDMHMGAMDKTPLSTEDRAAVMDTVNKFKSMAADPAKADKMKTEMAKMMVMDEMARRIAMDPEFQKQSMDLMNDSNVKKVHDEAMAMAKDPDQMNKIKSEIMGDEKGMKMVVHQAMMMSMHHQMEDKMGEDKVMGK